MTDADKLERIRSIVADHDAYGLSRHHEMVLDITDVLAEKEPTGESEARQLLLSMSCSQLAHASPEWSKRRRAYLGESGE